MVFWLELLVGGRGGSTDCLAELGSLALYKLFEFGDLKTEAISMLAAFRKLSYLDLVGMPVEFLPYLLVHYCLILFECLCQSLDFGSLEQTHHLSIVFGQADCVDWQLANHWLPEIERVTKLSAMMHCLVWQCLVSIVKLDPSVWFGHGFRDLLFIYFLILWR